MIEWLNRNPAVSAFGRCLECGRGERPGDPLLPFGTEPQGHAWVHGACWGHGIARGRPEAVAAESGLKDTGAPSLYVLVVQPV